MPMFNSVWDTVPGLVEKLKELLTGKTSMGEIAAELGNGLSRNAIIGKLHRIGWERPKAAVKISPEKVNRARTKTRIHIASTHAVSTYKEVTEMPVAIADRDITKEQRKTILQLESWHCRYPVGEPSSEDFFFCGVTAIEGSSYCAHHNAICYMPAHRRTPQFVKPQFGS